MITIELQRQVPKGKAVPGVMTLPLMQGAFRCETLENADYLIPAGTYPLKMTWSPRFKKQMPEICDVPERDGIRIHLGSKPEHSTGCVLVDVMGSEAVKTLFNQRLKWYDEKEMLISITDA